MQAHTEAHPFRDGTAGVEAKRRKLLSDRRDDLATMSHEIRSVYVARFSRMSAALTLCLGGGLLLAAGYSSALSEGIASYMPGQAPAPLATILLGSWLMAALALLGGRALAEHLFNLAMSRAVLPTEDVHVDVARLSHEHPEAVGRRMTARVAPMSKLASVLAIGLIMPATLFFASMLIDAGGYPKVDALENALAASSVFGSIGLLALSTVICLAVRPRTGGLVLLLVNLGVAVLIASKLPLALLYLLPTAFFLPVASYRVTRALGRQDARINEQGSPLPPTFNLRKRLRRAVSLVQGLPARISKANARALLDNARARLLRALRYRPSATQLVLTGMLVLGALAIATAMWPTEMAQSAQTHALAPAPGHAQMPLQARPSTARIAELRPDDGEGLLIDLQFHNGQAVDASYLLNAVVLPRGWRATITATLINADEAIFVQANPGYSPEDTPRQLSASNPSVVFEQSNCTRFEMPLQLLATPYANPEGSARLRYQVKLELNATCPG